MPLFGRQLGGSWWTALPPATSGRQSSTALLDGGQNFESQNPPDTLLAPSSTNVISPNGRYWRDFWLSKFRHQAKAPHRFRENCTAKPDVGRASTRQPASARKTARIARIGFIYNATRGRICQRFATGNDLGPNRLRPECGRRNHGPRPGLAIDRPRQGFAHSAPHRWDGGAGITFSREIRAFRAPCKFLSNGLLPAIGYGQGKPMRKVARSDRPCIAAPIFRLLP